MRSFKKAFSLIEMLVVVGILIVIGLITLPNFLGGSRQADLNAATTQIVAAIRRAQSQALSHGQSAVWGVHFSNISPASFSIFTGDSYASGTPQGTYALPPSIAYDSSTLAVGSSTDVLFAPFANHPWGYSASGTTMAQDIKLYVTSNPSQSSTIAISSIGLPNIGTAGIKEKYLYVADGLNGNITKLGLATHNVIAQFGSIGTGAGQFSEDCPWAAINGWGAEWCVDLGIDATGTSIYVADFGNNRIDKFTSDGAFVKAWGWGVATGASQLETCTVTCQAGIAGSGAGQMSTPSGVAIDQDGNVYVADAYNERIDKFTSDGAFVMAWGWGVATGASQFETCTATCQAGIACPREGPCYGQLLFEFPGGEPFDTPKGIAIHSSTVYVANGDASIQKFSLSGSYIGQIYGVAQQQSPFGGWDWGGGGVSGCMSNLTVDTFGNLYVNDCGDDATVKFDPGGDSVPWFNCADDHFGVAVDSAGNVYVGNNDSGPDGCFVPYGSVNGLDIQEFDSNGNFLTNFGYGQFAWITALVIH